MALGALLLLPVLHGCGRQQAQQAQQAGASAGAAQGEAGGEAGSSGGDGAAGSGENAGAGGAAGGGETAAAGAGASGAASAGASASEKLSVIASFYPMYDFAAKIGGDRAEVANMVPPGTEPHDWEPAAADMASLENADIFIYNGAGLEHWAEDVLGALQSKSLIAVEASAGIALMEGHGGDDHENGEIDGGIDGERDGGSGSEGAGGGDGSGELGDGADGGDDHEDGGFDPHVWLSPQNAKAEMLNIKNAFVQADPGSAAHYEANYSRYAAELDALDSEFSDAISALPSKDIIVSHQAFGYLCDAYGLNQVPIEGLSPDSEPDPARMAEIIEFARERDIRVVFFEELVSPKVAETIADAIGAETGVLSPIEGLSDEEAAAGDDYFSIMRKNLEAIKGALQP
jgi:zinc transport system substrate-binding protein